MVGLPKAVVIVGAGASYDVANEGVRVRDERWKPPLAKDLFSGHLVHYAEILAEYPGALALAQRLAPLGGRALESMLRDYAEHENEILRQYFKEVPLYLRDLLYQATNQYVWHPGNYMSMLIQMLAESPHDVAFVVLNYDTLLERALAQFDASAYSFARPEDWVEEGRQAMVVKIHGSIDWFRPLPGTRGAWREALDSFDPLERPTNITVESLGIPSTKYTIEERMVYPVLTAPLAGKDESSMVCPDEHVESLREFMAVCHRYLFIGTSASDDDLIRLLQDAVPQIASAHFVGNHAGEVTRVRQEVESKIKQFSLYDSGGGNREFSKGFSSFVSSDALANFLALPG